jgi:hypothetical protein
LPAAVLNDEATVTDATDAALTGGGSLTIPVWYNGMAWTKLGGGTGTGITQIISRSIVSKLSRWYSVLDKHHLQ